MPAGRPPKPLAVHRLNGNPRHFTKAQLDGVDNPQPEIASPEMPRGMGRAANREWKRIVPMLLANGLLTEIDGMELACYCRTCAAIEELHRDIKKHGHILIEPIFNKLGEQLAEKHYANPAVGMLRQAEKNMASFATKFGLDPASRSKLKVEKKDKGDAMSQFLDRKRISAPTTINPADMDAGGDILN